MEAHERPRPVLIPSAIQPADGVDADLAEVEAAIAMVRAGAAQRVRLVGLCDPVRVAGVAASMAQAAGLSFRADPGGPSHSLIIGPRT